MEEQKEFKLEEKEKKGNRKVINIVAGCVLVILSLVVSYNIGKESVTPKYKELEEKHNSMKSDYALLEREVSEANDKLSEAEPWFELSPERQNEIKGELKKAEEERIAKEEAERKAQEEEEARKQQEAQEAKRKEENKEYNTGITYNQLNSSDSWYKKVTFSGRVVGVVNDTGYDNEENLIKLAVNGDSNKIVYVRQIALRNTIGIALNSYITVRGLYEGIDEGYPSIIVEDRNIDR
ncbi:hypothetical protein [Metaclostridioides mangenotii]|uniref:hypothetical protein n=1 Tax=Metaclostridioides mangenotii TaxID=1540 RepID=UPI0028EF5026|nr:hypothetical protein [Clostridioides mangenotii]